MPECRASVWIGPRSAPDGDGYVLDGAKQFITSGKNGDVAIVFAVTDKGAGKKGISAFIVPTATPGYSVPRLEQKLDQHASDTAALLFENCRVPAENMIGEPGQGYRIALSSLEGGRIGIASQSIGMARAALEAALKDAGCPCLKEAAMAKLFASEMAEKCARTRSRSTAATATFPTSRSSASTATCG